MTALSACVSQSSRGRDRPGPGPGMAAPEPNLLSRYGSTDQAGWPAGRRDASINTQPAGDPAAAVRGASRA